MKNMECSHNERIETKHHDKIYQKCARCGKIRSYNPLNKKFIIVSDKDYWSTWGDNLKL